MNASDAVAMSRIGVAKRMIEPSHPITTWWEMVTVRDTPSALADLERLGLRRFDTVFIDPLHQNTVLDDWEPVGPLKSALERIAEATEEPQE